MIKKEKVESVGRSFPGNGLFAYVPEKLQKFCVNLSSVSLLEKNPRINDKASEKLAQLIKENGFRKPIVVDQNGKVRAGNTAYKAARILGMKRIPVAESDFTGEAEAMRYVVSDNKASEYSYWDTDLLKELVTSEKLDNKEHIKGLGLTDADLKKLFEIKKEKTLTHTMEVAVSVADETEAEQLYNRLTGEGYKCRVLAL